MHKSQESVGPLSLPANASLENLRKQAKTLLRKQKSRGQEADETYKLSRAQHGLAQQYGFSSWPKLVAAMHNPDRGGRVRREGNRVWLDGVPSLKWGPSPEPTYIGALEAAFSVGDRPLDSATLMGDSGLCFRLRWARGVDRDTWCGSSPVGEWPLERETLGRATGYRFDWSFPDEKAEKPVKRIIDEIDAGRPILAYGKEFDVSVIYGYEDGGERLILSDYWANGSPLVIDPQQIKGVTAWLVEIVDPMPRRDAVLAGLRLAVKRWHDGTEDTPYTPATRYYYGPLAYREWVADLKRADELTPEQRGNLYFLNGWNYSSLHMTRKVSAEKYLREQVGHLPDAIRPHVEAAADAYRSMSEYLGRWDPADDRFGYVKSKPVSSWTAEVRASEIEWLEGLASLDAKAMRHLEAAVSRLDAAGGA